MTFYYVTKSVIEDNGNVKEFVIEQKEAISLAKKIHFSKEAEQKILKMQMIFQDPMSSLNPIMRIGKQITEGMILNGKRLHNSYKKRFNI